MDNLFSLLEDEVAKFPSKLFLPLFEENWKKHLIGKLESLEKLSETVNLTEKKNFLIVSTRTFPTAIPASLNDLWTSGSTDLQANAFYIDFISKNQSAARKKHFFFDNNRNVLCFNYNYNFKSKCCLRGVVY